MPLKALHEIEHTQGTVQLISHNSNLQQKNGLVLVPQPNQNDPNDPLNWSLSRRILIFYNILFFSAMGNFCITGLAPGFGQIFDEFHCSTSQLSYLISGPGLGEALGCFFIAPLASRYGKRPLWVVSSTLFFICNIWAAASPNYSSLLVGRIFAAWASGTSEPLCVDTINDLFFLHERGTQTGVQGLWLCFGATLAPVAGGFLIAAEGWRWFHWVLAIFTGVNALLIFLFVPETQYRRDLHKSLDVTMAEDSEIFTEVADFNGKSDVTQTEGGLVREQTTTNQSATQSEYVKRTFWQDLKPWSGVRKDVSLFGAFIRPWALFSYVSVIWNVMAFSIHISCFVICITLIAVVIGAPPYGFSSSMQGLTYLSFVLGNVIGAYLCGRCNDLVSQRLARRNHGVFEPEMRLPVVLVPIIGTPIGLVLIGVAFHHQWHWIVPCIGFVLVAVGFTGIPCVSQPYLMDSYFPVAMDCLIQFNGFKNFVTFGVGFGTIPWYERDGPVTMFCILAALVIVIDAGAVLLYIYGKRLRHHDGQLKIFLF
ncbi:hypothetical protein, variant [Phialophora macrospora]|uniref:Major facilitator superfamily (MFS) profile domain-containing protein n=1 Tax=Phialophora macrospora TaxID=1851006 RepID=A0A0D2DYF3_9EURO|nr:hypothetical protein PV04_06438 [Phialophora macrospora]KIW67167.1 hypothetical protein, variant [Phialophora macrospora]